MPFLLFKDRTFSCAMTDEEKILFAIRKYLQAINYLEQSIINELCSYAKNTNNYSPALQLETFMELYDLSHTAPYLCGEKAILASYKKRDILLDQLAILMGDNPELYKGPNGNKYSQEDNAYQQNTIGGYRQISLKLNLTHDAIKNQTMRTPEKTKNLMDNARQALRPQHAGNNASTSIKSTGKASTYMRIQQAKFHLQDNVDELKKVRDTSVVDGFIWGIVRQIKRLFSPTSRVAEVVEEINPILVANTPCESKYVSILSLTPPADEPVRKTFTRF